MLEGPEIWEASIQSARKLENKGENMGGQSKEKPKVKVK